MGKECRCLQWVSQTANIAIPANAIASYGPTEATILMTVSKVQPDGSLNSIGRPLKHVTAMILPPDGGSLEPVPHGEVGELCVRGPQLAKGYLNRPEQTNEAFIRDKDGEPLYRTGDLARRVDDGNLEYAFQNHFCKQQADPPCDFPAVLAAKTTKLNSMVSVSSLARSKMPFHALAIRMLV